MDSFLLLRRLVAAIVFKGQTVSDYWWSRRTIFLTAESSYIVLVPTRGIPPAFRDGVIVHIYRRPPSGQSWVNRVTQLLTDGVPCRESADTVPVVYMPCVIDTVYKVSEAVYLRTCLELRV